MLVHEGDFAGRRRHGRILQRVPAVTWSFEAVTSSIAPWSERSAVAHSSNCSASVASTLLLRTTSTNVCQAHDGHHRHDERAGFRLQRHLEVAYTAPYHFNSSHVRRVKIRTGIVLEFVLHQHPLVWEASTEAAVQGADESDVRVVLVMGFLNTKETWAPTIETLLRQWDELKTGQRLRVLTFDNRGVGGSTSPMGPYTTSNMAEDVLALLDHVGWPEAHVVGYSMGGMISLELADMAPERVLSLTLLCTTRGRYIPVCNGVGPMTKTLDHGDPDVETHNLLVVLYPPTFLSKEMESDSRTVYEALFECHKYLVENRETPRVFGFVSQGAAVLSHFVSDERLHAIRDQHFPILVIGGARDIVIPARETQTLYTQLAASDHSRMVMYEDAGHGAFLQYLDEVAADIIQTVRAADVDADRVSTSSKSLKAVDLN
jgi:pimeloyl-ACP methyl ester carboxylesterase